jgi:hypothetical protein
MRARTKQLSQVFWSAVALMFVVGAFVAMVWLVALAIREGATVLAAILAAFATVAAATIARHLEGRRGLEATRREYLGPIYENLAGLLAGQTMTARKSEKVATDFVRKALIYASPRTLKAFREWRHNLIGLPPNTDDWPKHLALRNALLYEAFVRSMRKDLGVSNFTLQEGDLARSVLNDFDEHYAEVLIEAARFTAETAEVPKS